MFCPHCGNAVADGAKFCPACGNQIGAQQQNQNCNPQQNTGYSTQNTPPGYGQPYANQGYGQGAYQNAPYGAPQYGAAPFVVPLFVVPSVSQFFSALSPAVFTLSTG